MAAGRSRSSPRRPRAQADDLRQRASVAEPGEAAESHAERLRDALVPLVERVYEHGAARRADLDALGGRGPRRRPSVRRRRRPHPRTAALHRRPRRPAVDRRGLARHLHRALGQGPRVGRRPPPQRGRRQLPARHGAATTEGLEEERRLFYVAVTRPRRALHVYVPLRFHYRPRGRDDDHLFGQPSRFLSPAVTSCFEVDTAGHAETIIDEPVHAGAVVEVQLESLWN